MKKRKKDDFETIVDILNYGLRYFFGVLLIIVGILCILNFRIRNIFAGITIILMGISLFPYIYPKYIFKKKKFKKNEKIIIQILIPVLLGIIGFLIF